MLFTWSCGNKGENSLKTQGAKQSSFEKLGKSNDEFPLRIRLTESNLQLTMFSQWDFSVDGCSSGLSYPSISEADPSVNLYAGDNNCIAKLHSFGITGKTYIPRTGNDFVTYQVGEIALFENTIDPLDTMEIRVLEQLSSPLVSSDNVVFGTVNIQQDANPHDVLYTQIASQGTVTSDANPMNYSIAETALSDINTSIKSGYYLFTLECRSNIKQKGKGNPWTCNENSIEATSYRLVEDTFSGVPCDINTISDCQQLFDGSEETIDMNTEFIPRSGKVTNGGFSTKSLLGPDNLFSTTGPKMLLILKSADNYQFFSLDVATFVAF